jgi:hypothetical protein
VLFEPNVAGACAHNGIGASLRVMIAGHRPRAVGRRLPISALWRSGRPENLQQTYLFRVCPLAPIFPQFRRDWPQAFKERSSQSKAAFPAPVPRLPRLPHYFCFSFIRVCARIRLNTE